MSLLQALGQCITPLHITIHCGLNPEQDFHIGCVYVLDWSLASFPFPEHIELAMSPFQIIYVCMYVFEKLTTLLLG